MDNDYTYERTYTLADLARQLDRPRTTVKDWAELFREFLPTIGSGRTMRYKEECAEIFTVIAKMKDANEPNELIRQHLRRIVSEITVTTADDDEPRSVLADVFDSYKKLLTVVHHQQGTIDDLHDEVSQLREELKTTRDQVATSSESIKKDIYVMTEMVTSTDMDRTREMNERLEKMQKTILDTVITESRADRHKRKSLLGRLFGGDGN